MEETGEMVKQAIVTAADTEKIKNGDNKTVKESISEASFEDAVAATEFGKFNFILIAVSIPCGWAAMMASSTMSYVAPAAHCDLDMDLAQRGMLNAITYLGMITSAFAWGFLTDTLGRKKILMTGFLIDAACVVIAGLAQSYEMLLTAKYFEGLIINGPFAALTTVISEFHSAKYRTGVIMYLGITYSVAQMIVPGIAWLVIPQNLEYYLLDGGFNLHSWNFFILICAIPSMLSSLLFSLMPESPKFLMTVGRNEQALKVFKKVYSMNTGKHPDSFPIKSLMDESKLNQGGKHGGLVTANRTKVQALKEGWQQITPIFFPPLVWKFLLVAGIQCGFMLGANTLRLWLPQIFTAMNDYQMLHPDETASLCTMLEIITPSENATTTECIINSVSDFVYINSMIVAGTAIVGYSLVGTFINKTGKKRTMIVMSLLSGTAVICIYFAQNSATTIALAALNHTFIGICLNIEITIAVDIFPTSLRAIAVSMIFMIGRCGAMIGNIVFPYLLQLGCLAPFLLIGGFTVLCSLSSIFLPKTDMKAMV